VCSFRFSRLLVATLGPLSTPLSVLHCLWLVARTKSCTEAEFFRITDNTVRLHEAVPWHSDIVIRYVCRRVCVNRGAADVFTAWVLCLYKACCLNICSIISYAAAGASHTPFNRVRVRNLRCYKTSGRCKVEVGGQHAMLVVLFLCSCIRPTTLPYLASLHATYFQCVY
jgi:hypothetical protein